MVSTSVNVTSMEEHECKALFAFTGLPPLPNVHSNPELGNWDTRYSNVYFGQGQIDPLRPFTPMAEGKQPPRPVTNGVPKCNQPPPGNSVFGTVYEGASHVADLYIEPGYTDEAGVRAVQTGARVFGDALEQWLKCFKPVNETNGR